MVFGAELQECAISRSLAGALGGDTPTPWPTWESVSGERRKSLEPGMTKLYNAALDE